jgi:tRNA (cytidine/uridine-2'-O-)-methyltransferase
MFHIVLFQPEIPPNTGNVIRLCANSGTTLHLVKPLGFELTRKAVRRAGLDYEELAQVRVHANLPACLEALQDARLFSIETGGSRSLQRRAIQAERRADLRPRNPWPARAGARSAAA